MAEHKSMLCIGGPLDGKRFAAQSGAGFRVPVRLETSMADPNSADYQPNAQVPVEITGYKSEVFHTPQGDVSFWVPTRQTPLETITMLLEAYEAHGHRK